MAGEIALSGEQWRTQKWLHLPPTWQIPFKDIPLQNRPSNSFLHYPKKKSKVVKKYIKPQSLNKRAKKSPHHPSHHNNLCNFYVYCIYLLHIICFPTEDMTQETQANNSTTLTKQDIVCEMQQKWTSKTPGKGG